MRRWLAVALCCLPPVAMAMPTRSEFLARAEISATTIAPDGKSVAWLAEEGARRAVWLQTLDGARPRRAMAHTPAQELIYTRDGRWLLLAAPTQIFALAVAGQSGSGLLTQLEERSEWRVDATHAAAITVVAPGDHSAQRWQLKRYAVGGEIELLYEDTRRISGYALASEGRLSWLQRIEDLALVLYRLDSAGSLRETLRCGDLHRCSPVFDDAGELLLRSNSLEGDALGLARLVRIDRRGSKTLLARDPRGEADLDFLAVDATGRPRIAGYRSTVAQIAAIEPRDLAAVRHLQQAFPGSALRPQIAASRWLIEERHSARQFARWHLFDPETLRTELLIDERGGASPARLTKQPYTWTASDGMRLHGFISVPPGDVRTLPLVVVAHGGPWNLWQPIYNGLAQFIASRGAIVFEPNHRGSTGHGHAYMVAAGGDFGHGRVQRDIDEGVRSLLDAGMGDPQRIAIVGASYGGYAALLGVTFAPELYRAAVAFVPPPDFAWTLEWVLRNAESVRLDSVVPMADWLKMLKLDVEDQAHMERLRAQSPLANVQRLTRPVLIVAGGSDERVGIAGIIEYAARAKLAEKDVTVLIDHGAGHRQRDDIARETNLFLMETMLHRHLAMPKPEPPNAQVIDYLRNLRSSPATHRFFDNTATAAEGRNAPP